MEGPFAGLIEEGQIKRVSKAFVEIVSRSFERSGAGLILLRPETPTQAEVRRRTAILIRRFRELRGDLHWSVQRILDELPKVLRCELDGISWTSEDRVAWTPK